MEKPPATPYSSSPPQQKKKNNLFLVFFLLGVIFIGIPVVIAWFLFTRYDLGLPNRTAKTAVLTLNPDSTVPCIEDFKGYSYGNMGFCVPEAWSLDTTASGSQGIHFKFSPENSENLFSVGVTRVEKYNNASFCQKDETITIKGNTYPVISVAFANHESEGDQATAGCRDEVIHKVVRIEGQGSVYFFEISLADVHDEAKEERLNVFSQVLESISIIEVQAIAEASESSVASVSSSPVVTSVTSPTPVQTVISSPKPAASPTPISNQNEKKQYANNTFSYAITYPVSLEAQLKDELVSLKQAGSVITHIESISTSDTDPLAWWNKQATESYHQKPSSCYIGILGKEVKSTNTGQIILTFDDEVLVLSRDTKKTNCGDDRDQIILFSHKGTLLRVVFSPTTTADEVVGSLKLF